MGFDYDDVRFDEDALETDELYDILEGVAGVSTEAIDLVTSINGYSKETMYDILYASTGLRTFEQLDVETDGMISDIFGEPLEDDEDEDEE